jgi:hypothetical protein
VTRIVAALAAVLIATSLAPDAAQQPLSVTSPNGTSG